MTITTRVATREDHDAILRVARKSPYTKDFSNSMMFSSDAAYGKGWIRVAEEDGLIIGFTCVRHAVRKRQTTLYFIGVHPNYRSRGIGERLINEVMETGPFTKMVLNVMKDNPLAVKFYERLGFLIGGEAIKGQAHSMSREFPGGEKE